MLPDLKYVQAKGRKYVYFRTGRYRPGGKEILSRLPDLSDPKFGDTYAAHRAAKTRMANAKQEFTVSDFADLFERSPDFTKKLAAGSQRIYRIYLAQLKAALPTAPAGLVEQSDIAQMVDKRAEQPGAANSLLRVVNALYRWGRRRGHVTNNPGGQLEELPVGEHDPWPIPVLEAALIADDDTVRLATHMLYFTALRIGDVLRLRWSDIRDGVIFVTPKKTERTRGEMMIPLHESLANELARHSPKGLTILAKPNGGRWHEVTLRKRLQAFAAELGVKIVPHGLRKNAVNALLEAGCSVAETAAISNQSLQMVEHYAKKRSQGDLAAAGILRWQGNRERKSNATVRNAK
jgi:integrase